MKIISYNVNGLRAALKKDLLEWLKEEDPDIFCIQESKSYEEQIPKELFENMGYNAYWHSAEKKGYSGVATFSKVAADKTIAGIDNEIYDKEGRVLRTDYGDLTVLNCYFPSGSSSEERHTFKIEFINDFMPWIKKLLKSRNKLIVMGDYNIVHLDIDIHNPQRKDNPSGFRPEERAWLNTWFEKFFDDAFRVLHPDLDNNFSWWSYRAGSRQKNKGWRIDYMSLSKNLTDKLISVRHAKDAQHSDHAAIIMEIDLKIT